MGEGFNLFHTREILLRQNFKGCEQYSSKWFPNSINWLGVRDMRIAMERKLLCIPLPFIGYKLAELARRRSSSAISKTFYAIRLRILLNSHPAVSLRLKDTVPDSAASSCFYWFPCSCGTMYIGNTTRRLSECIHENHRAWLSIH